MSSKKIKETPKPSNLWRGIAFGSLATLLVIAGGTHVVIKNLPKPAPAPAPFQSVVVPTGDIPGAALATTQMAQLHAQYQELASVIVPLGEAFKLEGARTDALIQIMEQISETSSSFPERILALEEKAAKPVVIEKPKEAYFHKSVIALISAYTHSAPLKPAIKGALDIAIFENINENTVAALKALLDLPAPRAIQLADLYLAIDLLEPPITGAADISQTEAGWKARLGNLVTIRKITEAPQPTDWLATKSALKKALIKRDFSGAASLAEELDTTLAGFIKRYANQSDAWQAFLNQYASEAR